MGPEDREMPAGHPPSLPISLPPVRLGPENSKINFAPPSSPPPWLPASKVNREFPFLAVSLRRMGRERETSSSRLGRGRGGGGGGASFLITPAFDGDRGGGTRIKFPLFLLFFLGFFFLVFGDRHLRRAERKGREKNYFILFAMSGEQRSWKVCLRRLQICFGKFEQRRAATAIFLVFGNASPSSVPSFFFPLSFHPFPGLRTRRKGKGEGRFFLPLSEEAEEADGKMKEKISSSPPFLSHFFYPFLPLPSSSFVVPVSSLHPSLHPSFLANIKQTQICHASRSPHLPPSLLWEKARGRRRRRRKIPQTQIALSLFPFEVQSIRGSHFEPFFALPI